MEDQLLEANNILQQVAYAKILRNPDSASTSEKQIATQELRLINWRNIHYADVLVYTNAITERKDAAFLLFDKLNIEKLKLEQDISEETKQIIQQAETAFYNDQYNNADELILQFKTAYEQEISEASTLKTIQRGAKNFFQRYWLFIIIFLILLSIAIYLSYKKVQVKLLKKKIKKMKVEKLVLLKLIKRTQTERFKENKISKTVYDIRIKKYQEKLQQIKQELPVFEDRLTKKQANKTKN